MRKGKLNKKMGEFNLHIWRREREDGEFCYKFRMEEVNFEEWV